MDLEGIVDLIHQLVGVELVYALPYNESCLTVDPDLFCHDLKNLLLLDVAAAGNTLRMTFEAGTVLQIALAGVSAVRVGTDDGDDDPGRHITLAFAGGKYVVVTDPSASSSISLIEQEMEPGPH